MNFWFINTTTHLYLTIDWNTSWRYQYLWQYLWSLNYTKEPVSVFFYPYRLWLGAVLFRFYLYIVTPIVGVCNCSMICCTLLCVRSSIAIRESWLLCLICLPGVPWWLSGSSSRRHRVVCGLWLWYFLIILTNYFLVGKINFMKYHVHKLLTAVASAYLYLDLSVTSHINCIVARCLINVVYLTAYAFIRSLWRCMFWMTSLMTLNQYKKSKITS